VQQPLMVRCVTAAMRAPNLVVAGPPRDQSDGLTTVRTVSPLAPPEMPPGSMSFAGGRHLERATLLQRELPLRVVGIGLTRDLGVPCDGETMGGQQVNGLELPCRAARLA
jgi:hypothetical protein